MIAASEEARKDEGGSLKARTAMTDPVSELPLGVRRQMEIYQAGLAGKKPDQPISIEDLERQAQSVLTAEAYDYVAGGAGSEDTVRANREAFRRWRIVPRFLRDVSRRDLSVEVLGMRLAVPFMLAPIGVLSIVHKEADLAVARAARSLGVPLILSTAASTTMEDVARTMGDIPRWFQLYWPRDDELAASFVAAPSVPDMARSSSPSIPACSAGASATFRTPISRSSMAKGWRTTSATRFFKRGSAAIRDRARPVRSSTSFASSPIRRTPGTTWAGSAGRRGCRSWSRASSTPTMPGRASTREQQE